MAELPVQMAAADLASATRTSPIRAVTTAGVEEFLCFADMEMVVLAQRGTSLEPQCIWRSMLQTVIARPLNRPGGIVKKFDVYADGTAVGLQPRMRLIATR